MIQSIKGLMSSGIFSNVRMFGQPTWPGLTYNTTQAYVARAKQYGMKPEDARKLVPHVKETIADLQKFVDEVEETRSEWLRTLKAGCPFMMDGQENEALSFFSDDGIQYGSYVEAELSSPDGSRISVQNTNGGFHDTKFIERCIQ